MKLHQAYLQRMQVETTISLLDHYLLTGQVSLQDVVACLARHSVMPYLRHLELSGLSEGLPEDETEVIHRLLRLRLLFADNMIEESRLPEQLYCLRNVHHSLQAYVRNDLSRRDLEIQISSTTKKFHASEEIRQIIFELRQTLAEDPSEVQRQDVINSCFKAMRRIESFWSALLG